MAIYTVRRLAADILGVGENKIRMKPDELQRVEEALTRVDVQNLINDGTVYTAKFIGKRKQDKKKRRGEAGRRGVVNATKGEWMKRVRSQRRYLVELVAQGAVKKTDKRTVYMKIKSGIFKNKRTMLLYLKDNSLVGEVKETVPKFVAKQTAKSAVKQVATATVQKKEPSKAVKAKSVEQKK